MKMRTGFCLLASVWTLYHLAVRITGGLLTPGEGLVCGGVLVLCLAVLGVDAARWWNSHR